MRRRYVQWMQRIGTRGSDNYCGMTSDKPVDSTALQASKRRTSTVATSVLARQWYLKEEDPHDPWQIKNKQIAPAW